jgi:hypothetical protein
VWRHGDVMFYPRLLPALHWLFSNLRENIQEAKRVPQAHAFALCEQ